MVNTESIASRIKYRIGIRWPEDRIFDGILLDAQETMFAGNGAPSPSEAHYGLYVKDSHGKCFQYRFILPITTGITRSEARKGDRIIITVTCNSITVEVRNQHPPKSLLRILFRQPYSQVVHRYEASREHLESCLWSE